MSSITLRYESDLEPTLDLLKQYYFVTTKNKAILAALKDHFPLLEQLEKSKASCQQAEEQFAKLQELIAAKMEADDVLRRYILSMK